VSDRRSSRHERHRPAGRTGYPLVAAMAGHGRLQRMVLEVALINVTSGQEVEFTAAYATARETLATTPGCRSVRMTQGIESPSRFVLLVEWDSIEAHEQNFRATERFTTWRGHLGPHFAAPPVVEHFTDITT
jgi:heme-degrading monooxygenase HmoA